jgi:hypothetical protein
VRAAATSCRCRLGMGGYRESPESRKVLTKVGWYLHWSKHPYKQAPIVPWQLSFPMPEWDGSERFACRPVPSGAVSITTLFVFLYCPANSYPATDIIISCSRIMSCSQKDKYSYCNFIWLTAFFWYNFIGDSPFCWFLQHYSNTTRLLSLLFFHF